MNDLAKNAKRMHYATFVEAHKVIDASGDDTGTVISVYSEPVEFEAHLNAGRGSASDAMFGVSVDYNRTISTTNLDLPITETSLVWYETEPVVLDDGSADPNSADYMVAAKPLKGLNHLVIALKNRV